MNDDIFESVSQGSNGAYDEENRRIQEVSNELQRLCRLHEKEFGNGKANGPEGRQVNAWVFFYYVQRLLQYVDFQLETSDFLVQRLCVFGR